MDKLTSDIQTVSIDRNARAYGWEIGAGAPLAKNIEASPENPFLDDNWRDKVVD